jgi:hypothetical protein
MKRFPNEGGNEQEEGQQLIRAQSNAVEEEALLGPSFEGGMAGARTFSRRQALMLLGGGLVGVSLLSSGLATPAKAAGSVPMVNLVGPRGQAQPQLSAGKQGHWWSLTLEWTLLFAPEAVNRTFVTYWSLMEDDSTSLDDRVSATVEPNLHSATGPKKVFVPSQISPSNPRVVNFTNTRVWHQDDLDTELGGEELYAMVSIEDPSGGPVLPSGRWWLPSEILPLAP